MEGSATSCFVSDCHEPATLNAGRFSPRSDSDLSISLVFGRHAGIAKVIFVGRLTNDADHRDQASSAARIHERGCAGAGTHSFRSGNHAILPFTTRPDRRCGLDRAEQAALQKRWTRAMGNGYETHG